MNLDRLLLDAIVNGNEFYYCFDFIMESGEDVYLTNAKADVAINNITYIAASNIEIHKLCSNDCAENIVEISGVFEDAGIRKNVDLDTISFKLLLYVPQIGISEVFSYKCVHTVKNTYGFLLRGESLCIDLSKIITERYSQTCRADFGDHRCKVNVKLYSHDFIVDDINANVLTLKECNLHDGYFSNGKAIVNGLHYYIKLHIKNVVHLDKAISHIDEVKNVVLIAGCDKKINTCSSIFNNAINFRGEPFIPDIALHNRFRSI